ATTTRSGPPTCGSASRCTGASRPNDSFALDEPGWPRNEAWPAVAAVSRAAVMTRRASSPCCANDVPAKRDGTARAARCAARSETIPPSPSTHKLRETLGERGSLLCQVVIGVVRQRQFAVQDRRSAGVVNGAIDAKRVTLPLGKKFGALLDC